MRANFTVEDQGCIRRIEMLEDQRNTKRFKRQAEAYVGSQTEDISRLRHELAHGTMEMNSSNTNRHRLLEVEKEAECRNESISGELVQSRTK